MDRFTQASVSLIGMSMSFVNSLSGPLSVFGFAFLVAFRFGLGELWRESVCAANRDCLVGLLEGVLRSEFVAGGDAL